MQKGLDDEEKYEIEITNQIHNLLLEDYGLTYESFDERDEIIIPISLRVDTKEEKALIKRMPNLDIVDTIKYIY